MVWYSICGCEAFKESTLLYIWVFEDGHGDKSYDQKRHLDSMKDQDSGILASHPFV